MREKVDTELVRRRNRTAIIEILRRSGPLARIEIGGQTGLAAATITAITADMLSENLIVEDQANGRPQAQPGGRGRPRVRLALNPEFTTIIGVKIVIDSITLIAANFRGEIVSQDTIAFSTQDSDADHFGKSLADLIRTFVRNRGIAIENVAEVRLAAQGFVNSAFGSIVWSPAFSARDVPVTKVISRELGIDCTIANDVNMIVQALHLENPDKFSGTFCTIMIGYGVGAGLYINDRLHYGATGSAAEFGHMIHIPGGPLCRCGNRGCVEAHIADYAIYREAHQLPRDLVPSTAFATESDMMELENRAREGELRLVKIYDNAGYVLGVSTARLMALINPSLVVVTGQSMRAFPLMERGFWRGLESSLVAGLRQGTEFQFPRWDRDLILDGIVASSLHQLDRDRFAWARRIAAK